MLGNPKRTLILVMILIVIIGFGISQLYYKNENKYVDPRVLEARELYSKYDLLAQENNFVGVFHLLDSIEAIYQPLPHYSGSYELGVLYNNRAALFLTMALHFTDSSLSLDGVTILSKDSLIELGLINANKSITIYENWLDKFDEKVNNELKNLVASDFFIDFEVAENKDKYLAKRISEIEEAKLETKRRLSVAYTNKGIVERHKKNYEEAIVLYQKALDLWERNLTAKNNINVILGRPMEKGKVIHKFFPPDKEKE